MAVSADAVNRAASAASDATAATLDRLQARVGEGPWWDAVRSGRPVLLSDLGGPVGRRWPTLGAAAAPTGVRGIFALPMMLGLARLGALELFRFVPGPLTAATLADALNATQAAALLAAQTLPDDPAPAQMGALRPRIEVHRAVGIVMVERRVGAVEALARLRADAFARGLTVSDLANRIVTGDIQPHEQTPTEPESDRPDAP
ncbi:GAF and ANTAR domain-containing protein [Frankia sp. AgB1.9]|uniref:GAF and ANTAR domain-containing protein n=1 Tax=unclassified Frankia TaxID=2632575 RepID=UPI0019316E79|nr:MULTISPECIES: GAF and ANTAR domain-containing protein [unclassified Frankia]MBL7489773.1 GAF and ANTAR domain-containing protein [Frankia sp. AgW1.1]MBL7552624.1 GAF and ANTAR domain-containing protein [Frankia sp. AgB1.9]MBL7623712.1 GAF and ANTAR domain-containing protein [Frankia sp. AgB1.8]